MAIAFIAGSAQDGTPCTLNSTGANFLISGISNYTGSTVVVDTVGGNHNAWTAATGYGSAPGNIITDYVLAPSYTGSGNAFNCGGSFSSVAAMAFSGVNGNLDSQN